MLSTFYCEIKDVSMTNLIAMDSNGFSDPYFVVNFDQFEHFSSPKKRKTLNPVYNKYVHSFFYKTKFVNKLNYKTMDIFVYDADTYSKDDPMGKCKISLHDLASGPTKHVLALQLNSGKNAGFITFTFLMRMISPEVVVKFSKLSISAVNHQIQTPKFFLQISSFGSQQKISAKSKVVEFGTFESPSFDSLPPLKYKSMSLSKFFGEGFKVSLCSKKFSGSSVISSATIMYCDILRSYKEQAVNVDRPLGDKNGNINGRIKFICIFEGIPKYAQFKSGQNTNGIVVGMPLLHHMPMPKGYKPSNTNNVMKKQFQQNMVMPQQQQQQQVQQHVQNTSFKPSGISFVQPKFQPMMNFSSSTNNNVMKTQSSNNYPNYGNNQFVQYQMSQQVQKQQQVKMPKIDGYNSGGGGYQNKFMGFYNNMNQQKTNMYSGMQQKINYGYQQQQQQQQQVNYNQNQMNYNQNQMNYNQNQMNYNQNQMNVNQNQMNVNQNTMNYNQNQMGYNQNQMGYNKNQTAQQQMPQTTNYVNKFMQFSQNSNNNNNQNYQI